MDLLIDKSKTRCAVQTKSGASIIATLDLPRTDKAMRDGQPLDSLFLMDGPRSVQVDLNEIEVFSQW